MNYPMNARPDEAHGHRGRRGCWSEFHPRPPSADTNSIRQLGIATRRRCQDNDTDFPEPYGEALRYETPFPTE